MDVESHGAIVGSYTAKDGFIEVENKKHAQTLARMAGSEMVRLGTFRSATAPTAFCAGCPREHWVWALDEEGYCVNCREKRKETQNDQN